MFEEIETLFYYFSFIFEKNFFYVNETTINYQNLQDLTCSGTYVLTLAAKQQNHRIIREHLTFQIKILREAIFSTSIYLFVKTLFFIMRISNLIEEELYTRCVKVTL